MPKRLLEALSVLLLTGCVAAPDAPAGADDGTGGAARVDAAVSAPAAEPLELPQPPQPPEKLRPFPVDTLYDLLVAELALRRGDFDTAVKQYAGQATVTRDPAVVAQAARLAAYAGGDADALQLALLWAEVAPRDPDARQAAAVQLVRAGRLQDGLEQLAALRELTGDASFAYLAMHAANAEPEARSALLEAIGLLAQRYPDDVQLVFARALLQEQAGQPEAALAELEALPASVFTSEASLLRARLLEALGRSDEAIAWLRARLAVPGGDQRLRYTLARLLIDADQLDAAREQFETLLLEAGDSPEVLLSLGLIAMEQQDVVGAQSYLERLLASGRRTSAARYYLGMLAEDADDPQAALDHYGRVQPGYEFGNAQARAGRVALHSGGIAALDGYLAELRGRYPEERADLWLLQAELLRSDGQLVVALQVLDEALTALPDDLDLLYARALLREGNGDVAGLEEDLRRLLALDPDNASALNALGYTLANRTERFAEARDLVQQALALRPDDPAIIDSLGWVEYRQGNFAAAIELLQRAFELLPDPEVAAHLGEVLWYSGQQEAAMDVWRRGLQLRPRSDIVAEALWRVTGQGVDALGVPES